MRHPARYGGGNSYAIVRQFSTEDAKNRAVSSHMLSTVLGSFYFVSNTVLQRRTPYPLLTKGAVEALVPSFIHPKGSGPPLCRGLSWTGAENTGSPLSVAVSDFPRSRASSVSKGVSPALCTPDLCPPAAPGSCLCTNSRTPQDEM